MTVTAAQARFDEIRDRRHSEDAERLICEVDTIGQWVALQRKQTPSLRKLLQDCHQLVEVLQGARGYRCGLTRFNIIQQEN